jgi:O-methyltransferase
MSVTTGEKFQADDLAIEAKKALQSGDVNRASSLYASALRLAWSHTESTIGANKIAQIHFLKAIQFENAGNCHEALDEIVEAIHLDPSSGELREKRSQIVDQLAWRTDYTQQCFIFPDADRARRIYSEAIQRVFDFIVFGGVDGEIYEFGVLMGWTARLISEEMRDRRYLSKLRLFDSFEGLPREKVAIDLQSYDVVRGVWREEMDFSDLLTFDAGETVVSHIEQRLASVVSRGRIELVPGYFSDTLRNGLGEKAALVHLDCDLYSSTQEVLTALAEQEIFQDGTILMFDDWNCNKGNPNFGQRRAFQEFLGGWEQRYAASHFFNYGFNCACFILHDITVGT